MRDSGGVKQLVVSLCAQTHVGNGGRVETESEAVGDDGGVDVQTAEGEQVWVRGWAFAFCVGLTRELLGRPTASFSYPPPRHQVHASSSTGHTRETATRREASGGSRVLARQELDRVGPGKRE